MMHGEGTVLDAAACEDGKEHEEGPYGRDEGFVLVNVVVGRGKKRPDRSRGGKEMCGA